jgi:hypothetical protein
VKRGRFAGAQFGVVAVALSIAGACGGTSEPGGSTSIAGSYDTRWQRTAAVCSPVPLPAPSESNLANYLIPPTRDSSWISKVDVGVTDTSLTFIVSDVSGIKDPLGAYIGDTDFGPGVATRTRAPLAEGARGTHRFSATATTQFNYYLNQLVLTPPGKGLHIDLQVSSTTTYTYNETDPNGAVFTTCVLHDMGSATRLTN